MKTLRFGTFLAPNMLPVYEAITEEIGRGLGIPTRLVVETSYENCQADVNDICFVCSLPYIEYERLGLVPAVPIVAPVLLGARYAGKPVYFSDVIVHRESPFRAFKDLRGRSWAYNEPLSQSGYGIVRYHLLRMEETNGFFGKVIEAGFHEKSIRMVAQGDADASAIDSQVLAIAMRDDPALASSLRIIDALGPSTIQPIAVTKRMPAPLREKITALFLSMHENPAMRAKLSQGLIERFAPVGTHSYNDIRMMRDACEAAGFMEIR